MIDCPRSAADWARVREICCETGLPGGRPIEPERREFFAEYWIGPYQRICPDWTWVARDDSGEVIGYLTAAPRTEAFNRARFWRCHLAWVAAITFRRYSATVDTRRFMREFTARQSRPEERFPGLSQCGALRDFPAHLHMNLTASARGKRAGTALLNALAGRLCEEGIHGAHLVCGAGPVGFYSKQGFETLEQVEVAPGIPIFAMGRRWPN